MIHKYFVTGIGTEVGKTYCSAMLVKALKADYWKPVQAGDLHDLEKEKISKWSGTDGQLFPERYLLNTPASPHYAAELDNVRIELDDFELPQTDNALVVEGAGGLLVPLNEKDTIFDLIKKIDLPVVLVIKHYLGSINHSLLSLDLLKAHNIPIAAVIFNGESSPHSESVITNWIPEGTKLLYMPDIDWSDTALADKTANDWAKELND